MTRLEVFDPPMCCSTGVCGPEADEQLTRFAADLNWLKQQGVEVRRYNLAQEPTAFTANPLVNQVLGSTGSDGLPVLVVGDRVVSQGEYPSRQRLQALVGLNGPSAAPSEQPALAAEPTSIFDARIAELVALGAAIASNCEPCFRYHHRQALKLGVAREDMIQAVNVALQVKEEPARAMVRLAQKSLIPEAAQAGGCCGGGDGSSCC